ncbi:MAG TPA: hypothetical protein VFE62_21245 [Gemmataceae bacterium]|nr:hypothetical protein [Gemmataceae bacterium]
MFKWRLLVGFCSLALLAWGVSAFVEYAGAVGATGDAFAGWIYSGLGLTGLLALVMPRFGYAAAALQCAATAYAAWWCVLAFAIWQAAAETGLASSCIVPPAIAN